MEEKRFNTAKLDSKGRITLPFYIREQLGFKEGSEFLVVGNEEKEIKIFPLLDGRIAYFKATISDKPGALSKLLNLIAQNNIDLIATASSAIERGKTAEWTAIADISECKNIKRIEKDALSSGIVNKIEIKVK